MGGSAARWREIKSGRRGTIGLLGRMVEVQGQRAADVSGRQLAIWLFPFLAGCPRVLCCLCIVQTDAYSGSIGELDPAAL